MARLDLLAVLGGFLAACGSGDKELSADERSCALLAGSGTMVTAEPVCDSSFTPTLGLDRRYRLGLRHDQVNEHNCFRFQPPRAGRYLVAFDRQVLPAVVFVAGQPEPIVEQDGGVPACASIKDRLVIQFPAAQTYGVDLLPTLEDPEVSVIITAME